MLDLGPSRKRPIVRSAASEAVGSLPTSEHFSQFTEVSPKTPEAAVRCSPPKVGYSQIAYLLRSEVHQILMVCTDRQSLPAQKRHVKVRSMFTPKRNLKSDPEKRWQQSDRIFFGFGACHILTGVFLADPKFSDFYGEWIVPEEGFSGTHMYATNGMYAFDYHGFWCREKLLARYWAGFRKRYPGWDAQIERISFPLLNTKELNARKHLGPDQYFGDPILRAKRFISSKRTPPVLLG